MTLVRGVYAFWEAVGYKSLSCLVSRVVALLVVVVVMLRGQIYRAETSSR